MTRRVSGHADDAWCWATVINGTTVDPAFASPSSVASLVMFTQLSLFDLPGQFDPASPLVSLNNPAAQAGAVAEMPELAAAPQPVRIHGDQRRGDSIQPMGELARLVLARYEMVARRREERMRRQAEQPRKSIRVLSPAGG